MRKTKKTRNGNKSVPKKNGKKNIEEEIYRYTPGADVDIFSEDGNPKSQIPFRHYFTEEGEGDGQIYHFSYQAGGRKLDLTGHSGVFSKKHVDRGSDLLIRTVLLREGPKRGFGLYGQHEKLEMSIADLGTGYGIILLSLLSAFPNSRGIGFEVSNRALRLARMNAKKNNLRDRLTFVSGDLRRFVLPDLEDFESRRKESTLSEDVPREESFEQRFDLVVTNPPIRAGKDVVYSFFQFAAASLKDGGRFYAVISKNQGAGSAKKELERLFGNAEVIARESEFRVIACVRNMQAQEKNKEVSQVLN